MQKAIVRRTFDVVRNQRQEPIYAAKGDYGARYIQAIITADGVPYAIPENAVVTINAFRRDGKTNRFKGEVNADGSVIVPITQWMLEILGMVDCTISAVEEGGMLTTENFYVVANESSTNVEVSPDDPQYDLLTEVLLNEGTRQKQFFDMVEYINSLEQGKQGPAGPAGIHIGPEAPTDGQVAWIDTDEEPDEGEGGAQIDVVAKPGQVIVVATVDANGKPLTYKAVDLPVAAQPDWNAAEGAAGHVLNRTHYVDEKGVIHKLPNKFIDADWMATSEKHVDNTIVIPEQSVTSIWNKRQMDIQPGIIYDVHINGVVYPCEALNEDGGIILGNNTSLTMNDLPFCIFWAGGTATSGFFYKNSSVLSGTIYMKVTGHSYEKYNTLPDEFLPKSVVKSVNGAKPDENGNVEIDLPDGGGHFVEGAGELVFSHTATFATDSDATFGVPVPGVSVVATLNAVYWLEVNGEMLKCHWEKDSSSSGMILNTRILYDEGRNEWVRSMSGNVMVFAPTAGTYTYSLYAPSNEPMLDPRYIPANVAKKSDIPTGGGSASIDVTAQVGQTIIVKEVDASGKPTKWESADYQPRTHWTEEKIILPETTVEVDPDAGMGLIPVEFTVDGGKKYTVKYNGVDYVTSCLEVEGQYILGNGGAVIDGAPVTDDPFILAYTDEGDGTPVWVVIPLDGSASVTLSVKGVVCTPIPEKFLGNAFPYYIDAVGDWDGISNGEFTSITFNNAATDVINAFNRGREIKLRLHVLNKGEEKGYLDVIYDMYMGGTPSEYGKAVFVFVRHKVDEGGFILALFNGAPVPEVIPITVLDDGSLGVLDLGE